MSSAQRSHPAADTAWPAALARSHTLAVVTLDGDGVVTSWNAGAEHLFGVEQTRALGTPFATLFGADATETHELRLELESARRHGVISLTRRIAQIGGSARIVSATIVAEWQVSAAVGFTAVLHEIAAAGIPTSDAAAGTTHAADQEARADRAERQLAETRQLLASAVLDRTEAEAGRTRLLRRLVVAQEEERQRIARDLHDDLGQRLTALRLVLEALQASIGGRRELPPQMGKALQLLVGIDQDLDFLAWELRPAALDEMGLTKVLDSYVREWSRHTGVRATFHSDFSEADRFAPEIESSLYRIAQEALNNVAKHAGAASVNVLVEQRGHTVVLVVEDDGVGFEPRASPTMLGVSGIAERAGALGGTLEIEPTPHGGTTVLVRVPAAIPAQSGAASGAPLETAAASSSPGHSDDGAVVQTMRRRLQELQRAVAARDEFVATVAHELRNPIAPLTFQLRLAIERAERTAAADEPIPAEWVQSQLRRIEQRLHRLLDTLDRLLDVSRLSTGRIDLQPESMNIAHTVHEVVEGIEAELAVARCTLTVSVHGDPTGAWDRVRCEQICRNLLSNAMRFGAGGPIEVTVDAADDVVRLEVQDHGVGIPAEQQARIFERFERGAGQRSGGFGIGLWVVKNICLAMGGSVMVESRAGEGARFVVVLPRAPRARSAGADEE